MVHTVNDRSLENFGSVMGERWELDITSLDGAGEETSFEPAEASIDNVAGVMIIGQENADYVFRYDKSDGHLHVTDVGTASDTQSGTDVGEVELFVIGK